MIGRIVLAALATAGQASAAEIVWTDPVVVIGDGDGATVRDPATGGIEKLRLFGIDTPEPSKRHAKCPAERRAGLRATARAEALVGGQRVAVVWRDDDDDGRIDRGKYGRGLGDIWLLDATGARIASIAARLIEDGTGLPYDGGKRPDWCGTG